MTEIREIVRALDVGLEAAPESALAPVAERLSRACDGVDGRPTLEGVRAQAEETVLAQRAFAKGALGDGEWVRGTLSSGATRVPLYVPLEFERALPTQARWRAVVLAKPAVSRDSREAAPLVLAALAIGRSIDTKTLKYTNET